MRRPWGLVTRRRRQSLASELSSPHEEAHTEDAMDSLVDGCVDVIAQWLLAGASDPQGEQLLVQTLLDQIDVLPLSIGQRFSVCIQNHALTQRISIEPQDDDGELSEWTAAQRSLWTGLVERLWLVDLRMSLLPQQLLVNDVDWSELPLELLDCSDLIHHPVSVQAAALVSEKLNLNALVTLNLSGWDDEVSDELLQTLALRCQRLEDVDVSHCCKVTDDGLSSLIDANTETLRRLRANGLQGLTGSCSVESIEKCSRLHTLELEDCVSLVRLPAFGTRLPSVIALNLQGLSHITDLQLTAALAGVFHRLRSLRLGESEFSGSSLRHLLSTEDSTTSLHELDLSWCTHIERDAIAELVRRSPELRVLKLRCTKVDDTVLEMISSRSATLQVLDLERCDALTSDGFDALVASAELSSGGFQRLEKLNLSWTSVSEAALSRLLAQSAETIRKVRIQGCKELHSALLDAMLACGSHWPRLQLLDCSWINDIADEKLQAFADAVPTASVVGYYGMEVR